MPNSEIILSRYRRGDTPLSIAMDMCLPLTVVLPVLGLHISYGGYIVPDGQIKRHRVCGKQRR